MSAERLQRIRFDAAASPIDSATYYLAALAHHDDRGEFELFVEAVTACATTRKALSRSHGRVIDRTAKKIYEIRYYAAVVAHEAARKPVAHRTVRSVQTQLVKEFPAIFPYPDYSNFMRYVWNPSKPVLHLGIALDLCALRGKQEPILPPLMARAHEWLPRAASNAQYQAAILRKRFDDLGELVEIDAGEKSALAEHIRRSRPEKFYRQSRPSNPKSAVLNTSLLASWKRVDV